MGLQKKKQNGYKNLQEQSKIIGIPGTKLKR